MSSSNQQDYEKLACQLQEQNTLLLERLKRYEEVYGLLPSSPTATNNQKGTTTSTTSVTENGNNKKSSSLSPSRDNNNDENDGTSQHYQENIIFASTPGGATLNPHHHHHLHNNNSNNTKPQHEVTSSGAAGDTATSTLMINFSQDENCIVPMRFPNPYFSDSKLPQQQDMERLVGGSKNINHNNNVNDGGKSPSHLSVLSDEDLFASEPPTFPLRPSFVAAGAASQQRKYRDDAPHVSTQLVIFDSWSGNDPHRPSSMPIYQTATFVQDSIENFNSYDYTRSGNPTRTALEVAVAKLEGAYAAFAFSTGMAAIHSVVATLKPGDHLCCSSDLYGGAHRLFVMLSQHQGLDVSFIDTTDPDEVRRACKCEGPKYEGKSVPKLIHLESPSNPLMRISDLKKISEIAHEYGALVSCDCTMMTPIRQQPLQLGVDLVIHSGTKFLNGTSDTMSGFVAVASEPLAKKIAFIQNAQGSALSPFDCWLTLRGMKTLYIRLERQEINAVAVARFLVTQKTFIKKLHYIGLEPLKKNNKKKNEDDKNDNEEEEEDILSSTEESYALHRQQASGPSTVISFETGDVAKSRKFVNACKLFKITVSFGSCNSLVEMPCVLSHASIRKEDRTLPEDLIRLSIGIENALDLIADLVNAIKVASAV